jgi:integrase/recombinase XerC
VKKEISGFISYLKVDRGYSSNTQLAYEKDLSNFYQFITLSGVSKWSEVSTEQINAWVMKLRHQQINPKSIKRSMSTLRSFFSYLVNSGFLEVNNAKKISTPKTDQALPKTITYSEIELLTRQFNNSWKELRDIAIIEVMYSSALRVSELVGLDFSDIDYGQGFLKIFGKGSKYRYSPIGEKAITALKRYADSINAYDGAVFLSNLNKRISARTVQNMIKNRAQKVGIKSNVHPHMLRHAAASHFLQSSHDLRSVQKMLGHESIKSTQVYTHLDYLELSKVYDQFHPRAKK